MKWDKKILINTIKKYLGVILFLVYFCVQGLSVPFSGMTWDEPSSFFFGRTSLHFYLTGDRKYVTDSFYRDPKLFGKDPFQYIYGEDVYPPFPFTVASLTSYIFSEHLHLISPVNAHHLGLIVLGSIGVVAMYGIGVTLGWPAFLSAGIALLYGTYPTIIGQMRDDAKDIPLMSMIVLFVYMCLKFLTTLRTSGKKNFLWAIGTGISLGLAIGSKPTAALIVPIIALWFILSYIVFPSFRKKMGSFPKLIPPVLFIGVTSLLIFFVSWPWLWDNPVEKLNQVWSFFKIVGRGMPTLYMGTIYNAGVNLPWHYPLVILATQTPLSVLAVGLISLFVPLFILIKKRDPMPMLFLLWILIGMGRFFIPGVLIYAKVRHFIDVMPAFFILIGIFLNQLFILSSRRKSESISSDNHGSRISAFASSGMTTIVCTLLVTMLLQQVYVDATHFPYEPSFFNSLIGGTKTVADKKLFDIEYWASAVKEGMEYVDRVTPADKPVTVYACTMAHLALFYESPKVKVTSNPSAAAYTLVPNSASWFGAVAAFEKQNHELVYTVKRNGGDLFWVFKQKSAWGWTCGMETQMVYER